MSLPVTAPPPTSQESKQQPAASSSAMMVIGSRIKDYAANVMKTRKPWVEVFDRNSFGKPTNMSEAASRIRKNASYFKINYLLVMVLLLVVSFAMHPGSLFVLAALLGGWMYLFVIRQSPLTINGRTFSEREKLIAMSVLSLVVFLYSNVGTVVFSAALLGSCIIALHGAMRVPDDLFLDEAEGASTGMLSMFTLPTSTVGSANV